MWHCVAVFVSCWPIGADCRWGMEGRGCLIRAVYMLLRRCTSDQNMNGENKYSNTKVYTSTSDSCSTYGVSALSNREQIWSIVFLVALC